MLPPKYNNGAAIVMVAVYGIIIKRPLDKNGTRSDFRYSGKKQEKPSAFALGFSWQGH
jgi:hypothetical protein